VLCSRKTCQSNRIPQKGSCRCCYQIFKDRPGRRGRKSSRLWQAKWFKSFYVNTCCLRVCVKIILLRISIDRELSLIKNTGIYKLQVSSRKVNAKCILQNTVGKKMKRGNNWAPVQNSSILWCYYSFVNWENSNMTPLHSRNGWKQSSSQLSSQAYKQRNLIFMITFTYHIETSICPCRYYTPSFCVDTQHPTVSLNMAVYGKSLK